MCSITLISLPEYDLVTRKQKEGARGEQHGNNVSFSEKKTLIRALVMPRSQRDDCHMLSREQKVVLLRFRTGHNRLDSHMHSKVMLASSPTCPCSQKDQTTEHVLQRCSPSQSYETRCVASQHSPDNQTLQLQAGAGEDDIIHLLSDLDRVDCEHQEEEEGEINEMPLSNTFQP